MKKGIYILLGMMLVGVGICVGSLMFAPRGAERSVPTEGVISTPEPEDTRAPAPTPTAVLPGVALEDAAYLTCWVDQVVSPFEDVFDSVDALSRATESGDLGATRVQVLLLESDLQVAKAALLACPSPRHRLLVSSREKSLRGLDLEILAGQYVEEGISTMDADLMAKAIDPLLEATGLFEEAASDVKRYNVEVLGL